MAALQVRADLLAARVLEHEHGSQEVRAGKSVSPPRVRAVAGAALVAEDAASTIDGRGIERAQPLDAGVDAGWLRCRREDDPRREAEECRRETRSTV